MANKELRKMNRSELIEIIYAYQQNEKTIINENKKLKQRLKDRLIKMEEAGSIADASLAINKVLKAAQQAADDYTTSVKVQADAQADLIVKEAQEQVDRMMADCQAQVAEKQQQFNEMLRRFKEENPEMAEKWMAMTTVEAQN